MPTGDEIQIGDLKVRSFPISHDAADPVGYRIEFSSSQVVVATDVGCINSILIEAFQGADLAIIEANHELDWLLRGRYSPEMKARVASDRGHLSNLDCANFVAELLDENGPCTVWLAHLSHENNTPSLAKTVVTRTINAVTKTPYHLEVALRDSPSLFWQLGLQSVQTALW
jgi:phosphoribosyl 1,2-cyclic phosphodiesterase